MGRSKEERKPTEILYFSILMMKDQMLQKPYFTEGHVKSP